MSAQLQSPNPTAELSEPSSSIVEPTRRTRNRSAAGIALIAIGLLVLIGQLTAWTNLVWLVLPGLGLIFLIWGLSTRNFGLMVPGCILGGLGLGLYTMTGPLSDTLAWAQPSIFLFCFAAGFALISLFSLFMDDHFHWWPLIPAGMIALVGVALITGGFGLDLLKLMGLAWPLLLIGLGVFVLLRRKEE